MAPFWVQELELRWDLSLRTLLRRAATTTSVWLQEETNVDFMGNLYDPGKKMIELFGGTGKDDMERDLEERGKLTSNNENIILECLWIGKSTGCAEASAYAKVTQDNQKGEMSQFWFEAWWIMEESCKPEVRQLWEITSGNIPTRLVELCVGLLIWMDRNEETIAEILDVKLHLSMEIAKEELYWE
ncbi:hypothetical protein Goari_021029 [Gossypium aridum]|uniref:Uncharacterized protein n=1 Tax=Gossypium aridum TaxID=34290 RepID=A0A7J8YEP5_GOSAI|nr:hypothetical protein [Gossypium aridum]